MRAIHIASAVATIALVSWSDAAVAQRSWQIKDQIEIGRIVGTAVAGADKPVAYVLRQPVIAKGDDIYTLYVVDRPGAKARKLAESSFIDELQLRPGKLAWTARADLGKGVQLYEFDMTGKTRPLVVNPVLAPVGGNDGLATSSSVGPHPTGVSRYGWSVDGKSLWYTKLRVRNAAEAAAYDEAGVVYDETANAFADYYADAPAVALEVHVIEAATGRDVLAASLSGDRIRATLGIRDVEFLSSGSLTFLTEERDAKGVQTTVRWTSDLAAGRVETIAVGVRDLRSLANAARSADGRLTLRDIDGKRRLVALGEDDSVKRDYGVAEYTRLSESWMDERSGRSLLLVHYPLHDGLVPLFDAGAAGQLAAMQEHLSHCSFDPELNYGACSREGISQAPELVSIDLRTGKIAVLDRPNARYDSIAPLRSEYAQWTNRHGNRNDGYVTYPRNYEAGKRYPAIVVTHARDAQNQFAAIQHQYHYPVQVWAERGYVVLSVNEPEGDMAALQAYWRGSNDVAIEKMQFYFARNPVAGMEAAAQSLIDQGVVDPDRVGIAGYSRGSSITTFAMSQSKLFRVGSSADAPWFASGGYWNGGSTGRGIFTAMFGGAPWDAKFFENYRAVSPSMRGQEFAGPLLQQYTASAAPRATELHMALRDADVPTELIFYRHETHVLHNPRAQAAAAQSNLDWFDYWLLGKKDPDPAKAEQFRRWDAMAERWRARQQDKPQAR